MKIIAEIQTDMKEKFGLPRQSGLVPGLRGRIVFRPEFKSPEALRGLEGFSHIWVIWRFDGFDGDKWSPTVRPPRLGGNKRMGVFATRSPNRPNPIGMSVLRLDGIDGTDLLVAGIEMRDGTAVYDIKPYLKISDCIPDASDGFTSDTNGRLCDVAFECDASPLSPDDKKTVIELLEQDPRPAYKNEPDRIYGMNYKGYEIRFKTADGKVTVIEVKEIKCHE